MYDLCVLLDLSHCIIGEAKTFLHEQLPRFRTECKRALVNEAQAVLDMADADRSITSGAWAQPQFSQHKLAYLLNVCNLIAAVLPRHARQTDTCLADYTRHFSTAQCWQAGQSLTKHNPVANMTVTCS